MIRGYQTIFFNFVSSATSWRKAQQRTHQASDERVHGVGQGWAKKDLTGVPRHAQLEHQQNSRWVERL